jgi:hypothetical protein
MTRSARNYKRWKNPNRQAPGTRTEGWITEGTTLAVKRGLAWKTSHPVPTFDLRLSPHGFRSISSFTTVAVRQTAHWPHPSQALFGNKLYSTFADKHQIPPGLEPLGRTIDCGINGVLQTYRQS